MIEYDTTKIRNKLMNENTYYNGMKLKSNTDCDILQSIGARGCGKTTWWIAWFILDFIDNGKQFTHLVRYKDDLKEKDIFFNDVQYLFFNDFEFKIEGDKGFIRLKKKKQNKNEGWEWMCLFKCISRSKTLKGTNYPQMYNILFDEFQIDTTDRRLNKYITGELKYFGNIVQSLKRTRKGIVVMLSNAVSITNPYFNKWGITPEACKIVKRKLKTKVLDEEFETRIACESVDASNYLQIAVKSQAAKISMICGLSESDIENQYMNDNDDFIRKDKPNTCKFAYNVKINEKYYGVWQNYDGDTRTLELYVMKARNPQQKTFCFKKEDVDENTLLIKSINDNFIIKALKSYVVNNLCFFQTQQIKGDMFEIFSILNIY